MSEPLSLVFEFARADTPEDPYGFRFKPQDYTLRTTHGGRKRLHLAWSNEFLDDLDALHASYCDPAIVQRVGRALCTFLEPSGWTWHAQAIAAANQRSSPVLLTVRSAAAELYTLPWELLPLEATGQCVGELPGLLIRYEWPETHTVPLKRVRDANRRRLLVAWSAAAGEVPASEHVDAVGAACRAAGWDFKPDRDVIEHASVGKLADALDQANSDGTPVVALHLLCHAGRAGRTWGLMLNGEEADAALTQQATLEDAFLLTRKQLARDAVRLDWAGLQLYARGADGHETRPFRASRPEVMAGEATPSSGLRMDLDRLDLPALLKLQTQVREALASRFESQQALVCVELADVDFRAGPPESGLHKRCYGLLSEASTPHNGRIFATQGDSMRACYPSGKAALRAVLSFIDAVTEYNYHAPREDQIMVSIGLHWGTVLTNGRLVTGPSVDAVARIAEAAGKSRLLVSQHALNRIPRVTQALCTPVVESVGDGIELYTLPWADERGLVCKVWIEESGEQLVLPRQDTIAFGRLDTLFDGNRANDVVLTHPDGEAQLAISRWHFELRRTRRGHMLRRVSSQLTEVDGRVIEPGEEAHVRPGTTVRLAQVMTLRFLGSEQGHSPRDAVTLQHAADPRMATITLHEAAGVLDDTGEAGSADRARAPVA